MTIFTRFPCRLKAFYDKCREGRDKKKAAVIAAMRKLLTILNARMRDHLAEPHISPETALCAA